MCLYKCSHYIMMLRHRKFNDDIFARFLVIMKNVVISFIKEYRGPTFRPPWDIIDEVIIMKKTFLVIRKWPPFWARDKLLHRKLYRKLNKELDVIVHKNYFSCITLLDFWPFCNPTSLEKPAVELETRHSHQILLIEVPLRLWKTLGIEIDCSAPVKPS